MSEFLKLSLKLPLFYVTFLLKLFSELFLLLRKVHLGQKTREKLQFKLFFDITAEQNKILKI